MRVSCLLASLSLVPSAAGLHPVQTPLKSRADANSPLPLIIWHGLGDNYQNDGLVSVARLAEETLEGVYVYLVHLADDASGDRDATFFGNLTEQIDQVCTAILSDPVLSLAPAVNALGFSQGGQFLRGYVERCNNPPVANLVTFGSQHNGISDFQECSDGNWFCQGWQSLLKSNTWSSFVQNRLVPAQYYRDPEDIVSYLKYSNFLADINNERHEKSETYKENMKKLRKFVMYVFDEDTTVVPRQSGWFSEYNTTSQTETKLQNRALYTEDWLGLKWLDENERLLFRSTPGPHMSLDDDILRDTFLKYFSSAIDSYGSWASDEL